MLFKLLFYILDRNFKIFVLILIFFFFNLIQMNKLDQTLKILIQDPI